MTKYLVISAVGIACILLAVAVIVDPAAFRRRVLRYYKADTSDMWQDAWFGIQWMKDNREAHLYILRSLGVVALLMGALFLYVGVIRLMGR
jgi:hypothetical protein